MNHCIEPQRSIRPWRRGQLLRDDRHHWIQDHAV